LREAFARRSLDPNLATATELYAIACNFGVGQSTLVNHLAYGIGMMGVAQRAAIGKITPKMIRTEVLGQAVPEQLVIADRHWNAPTLDAEIGSLVLLPSAVFVDTAVLVPDRDLHCGRLFRVVRSGISRAAVPGTPWATYVRAAPRRYVGLARYRHLEEVSDE
jgi:hypothetical protein